MDSREFKLLREKAGMTQADLAEAMGTTVRTISGWEVSDPPRGLSSVECQMLQRLFVPHIIEPSLVQMTDEVFSKIPSELIAIWLVHGMDCVLLPRGVRIHDFETRQRSVVPSPYCVSSLVQVSLTTYPLRTGETVNLAGESICEHPAKKYKNRAGHHFHWGMCESLLHVPTFIPSPRGPQPVLLLSLENKLKPDETGPIAAKGGESIYTPEEARRAHELADSFKERLVEDMRLLHLIE